jgi:hypothetical protein
MAKRSNRRDIPDDWRRFAIVWASDRPEFTSIELEAAIIAEFPIARSYQEIVVSKGQKKITNQTAFILKDWGPPAGIVEHVYGYHNSRSAPYRLTEHGKREAAKLRSNLRPRPNYQNLIDDLQQIQSDQSLDDTERGQLIQARIGQGEFRDKVLVWAGNRCAVTGSTVLQAIRASHIKPWRDCNNKERLDPNNGLALTGTLDALFDAHLITFQDDGAMQVSPSITDDEQKILGLPMRLRVAVTAEMGTYLIWHRKAFDDKLNPQQIEPQQPVTRSKTMVQTRFF